MSKRPTLKVTTTIKAVKVMELIPRWMINDHPTADWYSHDPSKHSLATTEFNKHMIERRVSGRVTHLLSRKGRVLWWRNVSGQEYQYIFLNKKDCKDWWSLQNFDSVKAGSTFTTCRQFRSKSFY